MDREARFRTNVTGGTYGRIFRPTPAAWEHAQIALTEERVMRREQPHLVVGKPQGMVEWIEDGELLYVERPCALGWKIAWEILDANERFQYEHPEETKAAADWRATNIED